MKFFQYFLILTMGISIGLQGSQQPKASQVEKLPAGLTMQDECMVCLQSIQDLGVENTLITNCCKKPICKPDARKLEKTAQNLYKNLQDPAWRARYAATPGFTGWPEDLPHAKCPNCRHYPLTCSPLVYDAAQEQAAAATKIQALARGHLVRKDYKQQQEQQKKTAAASKIQKAFRARQDRKKKEAAAQIIQKAGQGFFARKFLPLESTLNNMPYLQFRDLICSGKYINKTDWFYRFIETKENKKLFTRDKDGKIDLDKVETISPEIDFDTLFHKYITQFHAFCYEIFRDRATDEIVDQGMSWSQAVSIMQDDQPQFPIVFKYKECPDCDDSVFLVLAQIFNDAFLKYFPDVVESFPVEIDTTTYADQGVMLKALGFDWFVEKAIVDDNEAFEEEKEHAMQYFLEKYCESLGFESLPKVEVDIDNPAFGIDLLDPFEWDEKRGKPKFSDTEGTKLYQMQLDIHQDQEKQAYWDKANWVLAAQQIFQLGRLLFENKLDAFEKLGGQAWLDKQPKEIITIAQDHLKKLRKPTLRQRFLNWYGLGDNSLSDVQGQMYHG